jgi:hypothetical protein
MNTKLGMLVAKEFSAYFQTPIATFFLVIFSVLSVSLTFFLGDFAGGGDALVGRGVSLGLG